MSIPLAHSSPHASVSKHHTVYIVPIAVYIYLRRRVWRQIGRSAVFPPWSYFNRRGTSTLYPSNCATRVDSVSKHHTVYIVRLPRRVTVRGGKTTLRTLHGEDSSWLMLVFATLLNKYIPGKERNIYGMLFTYRSV